MTHFRTCLMTIAALAITASASSAATIIQDDANYIAFEAEVATIDNSFGTPSTGWVVDGATVFPSSPSEGSFVVTTERTTGSPPTNLLTFDITLINDGGYRPWFRVAYSNEDTTSSSGFHDSWYFQSGLDGGGWKEDNGNSVNTSSWTWHNGGADVTFSSTGSASWAVSSREDWLIIDRIVLISEDNTDSVDAAYLDGLENSVIPEPASLALFGLGGLMILARRRGA
mgnify:FL=1